jgi:cobalt-zinc-cadmium efflux system outer membrane protein
MAQPTMRPLCFRLPVCALAALTTACATVQVPSAPIAPVQTVAAFDARTLDSSDLKAFIEAATNEPVAVWPPTEWDLDILTLAAFYYHPDLDVARAEWGQSRAAIVTAGGRPNPELGFAASLVRGGDPGDIPWILQPRVGLVIETAGKRGHRIAQAEAVSEASRFSIADMAWQVRSRVRANLLDHLLAMRELDLLRAEETVRADYADALQTKLDFGDASRQEVDVARLELQRLRVAVRAGESQVEETRVALAGAIGVRPATLTSARLSHGALDTPPPLDTAAMLDLERNALLARTDILAALATYQAAEAAVRLDVARQFPDLQIGPGFRWRESERRWVFDFGVPIPLLNRNEGPIAEAMARRQRAAADVLALQAATVDAIAGASTRYAGALREVQTAREVQMAAETRQGAVSEQFTLGDVDRTAMLGAGLEVTLARAQVMAALRKAQMELGILENAIRRPLEPGVRAFASPEAGGAR